jgi:hypothetical protein
MSKNKRRVSLANSRDSIYIVSPSQRLFSLNHAICALLEPPTSFFFHCPSWLPQWPAPLFLFLSPSPLLHTLPPRIPFLHSRRLPSPRSVLPILPALCVLVFRIFSVKSPDFSVCSPTKPCPIKLFAGVNPGTTFATRPLRTSSPSVRLQSSTTFPVSGTRRLSGPEANGVFRLLSLRPSRA